MSEQNKDGLENFFRKGAENYNIAFRESDWENLEARLDKEMPVAPPLSSFLKKWWPLWALILISPAIWYFTGLAPVNEKASDSHEKEAISPLPNNRQAGAGTSRIAESETPLLSTETEVKELITGSMKKRPFSHKNNSEGVVAGEKASGSEGKGGIEKNTLYPASTYHDNKNLDRGYAVPENGPVVHEDFMNPALRFLSPVAPESKFSESDVVIDISMVSTEEILKNDELTKRPSRKTMLMLGIAYSPDLSTVGLDNFTSPGSRWKVFGELHFLKRFAVTTGIVWVNNRYIATKGEYVTPVNLAPDLVDADCKMIDIPLNIRYDIISADRHRAYVSGGASTYFVLSQYYDFSFDQDNPSLPDKWQSDKTVKYPFSIINFSVGYEYRIGGRSALQVEPFIKLPIEGIGWGSVELNTIGIYLSYKLKIGKPF